MLFKYLKLLVTLGDDHFNQIYPAAIRKLACEHWTPVNVAQKAAEFLVPYPGTRVLDIGSGAGKFCLVGAVCTAGSFTGVEQRANLAELSNSLALSFNVPNAEFVRANVMEISLADYDTFYFFNSFYENVSSGAKIDKSVTTGREYYLKYSEYLNRELLKRPPGTRLVTYWSTLWEVPNKFEKRFSDFNGLLNFWEKVA